MKLLFAIALGGAIGALGRHFVARSVTHALGLGFPYGTLTVNVVGGFAMGVIIALLALRLSLPPAWQAFLTVGLLGGFTTFSAFSLEVVLLIERGTLGLAGLYVAASVILSVAALFAGLSAVRYLALS